MSAKLSRREFLRISALAAAGAAVIACQPKTVVVEKEVTKVVKETVEVEKEKEVTKVVKETVEVERVSSRQAPVLQEMVKAGTLPSLEERSPLEPRVIDVVEEIGQYGGTWRRAFIGPSDGSNWARVSRRGLLSWTMDGSQVVPQVVKGWEISNGLKTYTFQLRKGMKWFDGEPFTADDIMFWWEGQVMNDEMSPSKPSWMKIEGELGTIEKVDDYTFKVVFARPYPLILDWFANREIYTPGHYMGQFHPEYTDDKDALTKKVSDEGFDEWYQLFGRQNDIRDNPDRPQVCTWAPFESTRADTRFVWKRNPYYFCVDPEGNQLPYLDEVVYGYVDNVDVLNVKAASGELDMQGRHVSIDNYPVLMDGREKGDFRVLLWPNSGGADAGLMFNQSYVLTDPAVGEWLANKEFRQALSIALDREEINEAAFLGLGEPRQLAPPSYSPFYPGDEHVTKYTEYDPDKATEMLDDLGLDKKNADGFRLRPDGEVLNLTMLAVEAFGPWADVGELAAQYWQAVGIKAQVEVIERSLYYERMKANEMQIGIWNTGGAEHTFTYPYWASAYSAYTRIGPFYGLWWTSGGQGGEEPPPGPLHKVMDLHEEGKGVIAEDRAELGKEIFRINCEEIWTIGTVGLSPMVMGVIVCKNKFRNVPEKAANNVIINTPGNAFPEQFFWKK